MARLAISCLPVWGHFRVRFAPIPITYALERSPSYRRDYTTRLGPSLLTSLALLPFRRHQRSRCLAACSTTAMCGVSSSAGSDKKFDLREVGYITDVEGDIALFERYVAQSSVLQFGKDGNLEFMSSAAAFVFGGDACDRGPGDLRIVTWLVDFKTRHPDRVFLLMGNRDINKMRLTAELHPSAGGPESAFHAFWDKRAPTLHEYLNTRGVSNSREERLHWMLKHTLGCPETFEFRRAELSELRSLAGDSDSAAVLITNEEVVQSFADSVLCDDGVVTRYLQNSQLAVVIGDTLYVHGAAEERALGFVPGLATRFAVNSEDDLERAGARHEFDLFQWVDELNAFAQAAVAEWRARPTFDAQGRRGGEALMAYQCRPAVRLRTVVVTCYVDGLNMPTPAAMENLKEGFPDVSDPANPVVTRYLRAGGVARVVVGHKPSGEAPAVLRAHGGGIEVVSADTNYASTSSADMRGGSWCEVLVSFPGEGGGSQCRLRGALADGRGSYDFALPRLGEETAGDSRPAGDNIVGRQTQDGWWARVRLAAGEKYLFSRGRGREFESRIVEASVASSWVESSRL